jgi:hypothetical protein
LCGSHIPTSSPHPLLLALTPPLSCGHGVKTGGAAAAQAGPRPCRPASPAPTPATAPNPRRHTSLPKGAGPSSPRSSRRTGVPPLPDVVYPSSPRPRRTKRRPTPFASTRLRPSSSPLPSIPLPLTALYLISPMSAATRNLRGWRIDRRSDPPPPAVARRL